MLAKACFYSYEIETAPYYARLAGRRELISHLWEANYKLEMEFVFLYVQS